MDQVKRYDGLQLLIENTDLYFLLHNFGVNWWLKSTIIYKKKKTSRSVSESYAVQKQREEVVGSLHIFLADDLWPKIQISFVKVTEILMYLTIFHFKKNIKSFFFFTVKDTPINIERKWQNRK